MLIAERGERSQLLAVQPFRTFCGFSGSSSSSESSAISGPSITTAFALLQTGEPTQ